MYHHLTRLQSTYKRSAFYTIHNTAEQNIIAAIHCTSTVLFRIVAMGSIKPNYQTFTVE